MTAENTLSQTKRVCSKCSRDWTHTQRRKDRRGLITHLWHKDGNDGWMCQNCYSLYVSTPKHNPKLNQRRLRFKDKILFMDAPIRIGVCNYCRAVVPFDCKHTHMHHESYHEDQPLKDTIELCESCHHKIPTLRKRGRSKNTKPQLYFEGIEAYIQQ